MCLNRMMFIVFSTISRGVYVWVNSLRWGAYADITAVPRTRLVVKQPHDLTELCVFVVANPFDLRSDA